MKIMGLGLNLNGKMLFEPMEEEAVVRTLVASMEPNAKSLKSLTQITSQAVSYRGEIERTAIDPGDLNTAGWTFLVNSSDPQRHAIETILEPLCRHRKMLNYREPLLYNGESEDEWFDWLHDNYFAQELEGQFAPQYILLIGGPGQIPFHFQAVLNNVAKVGRLDFDSLGDLQRYVEKVIRIETALEPLVSKETVLFAPNGGPQDPTYFSDQYMVKPLAEYIKSELGFETFTLTDDAATKTALLNMLCSRKPALVYTASHGLGEIGKPDAIQKRYNGAICCQHTGPLSLDSLFTADDVPVDRPFLEGSIFFQFACFGYGTPQKSDYAHWLNGIPEEYTEADFVAALPKKLLAHSKGPIAFIGHLDTAFLHGFTDAAAPYILDRWHNRMAPFIKAVNQLLKVQPSGLSMRDMNTRYALCNNVITNIYDRQCRGKLKWDESLGKRFMDNWITRGDAQNYMILGDPAVRLRIPDK